MNRWAKDGRYDCNFLCICVLGDASAVNLSEEMSRQMKLTHCVNGFIDCEQDMPPYGQLGCQGFIVLDAEHRPVSTGTTPFMQVRDLAFGHVEALLDAVCSGNPLPKLCPGEYALLEAPPSDRQELKGSQGICIKVEGDSVHFGFMDGPLRGRAMVVPASTVSKLADGPGGGSGGGGCSDGKCGSGGCGPTGCSDGKCAPGGGCADGKCGLGGCAPGGGCSNNAACESGGCDGAGGCDGSGGCLDEAVIESSLDLVSVKVPSMDAEHEECAQGLRELARGRKREVLEAVLHCLDDHFKHEEALFVEFDFGAHANENLSARKSHMEDHARILGKVRRCLQENANSATVSGAFVLELLRDFHEHTTRYDTQYAEPLSAKGAK